jgi:hypothetical protein
MGLLTSAYVTPPRHDLIAVIRIEGHGVTMTQEVKAVLARIRADGIYHGRYARGRTGGNRTER